MNLIIDNRERELKNYFKNKESVEFRNLDIGDIVIEYNQNVKIIIERKTLKDLSTSIKDGRYKEQKARLKADKICNNNIFYLIEGRYSNTKIAGISYSTLISSMLSIMLKDNFKIIRTENLEETIKFIEKLFEKCNKDGVKLFEDKIQQINDDDYISSIKSKKKKNLTPLNCFKIQLSQIPGISDNIAKIISEKYSSFKEIILEYSKLSKGEALNMFKDITYSIANNKKRRIGEVLSNRIYLYINYN